MFRLTIQLAPPIVGGLTLEESLASFLSQIGIIKEKSTLEEYRRDPAFAIMNRCFLSEPDRIWDIKEMASVAGVSVPTVYRVLKKLRECDILEFVDGEKGYRLRYADLSRAWRFVETHVHSSMENYRKSVEYIQNQVNDRVKK